MRVAGEQEGSPVERRAKEDGALDDVRVEAEDAKLVGPHDSTEKLHDERLVIESVLLVCEGANGGRCW